MGNFELFRQTHFIEGMILRNPDVHLLLGNSKGDTAALQAALESMEFEIDEENISQCVAALSLLFMQVQLPDISGIVLKEIVKKNRVPYIERY